MCVEHFPVDRGRGDHKYANDLWLFRCAFQKERLTTDKFQLIAGAPDRHLEPAPDGRTMLVVKTELDEQLESDIVDAAARSNLLSAINALPQHLRILATQRRREMQREQMQALERARINRPKKTARP